MPGLLLPMYCLLSRWAARPGGPYTRQRPDRGQLGRRSPPCPSAQRRDSAGGGRRRTGLSHRDKRAPAGDGNPLCRSLLARVSRVLCALAIVASSLFPVDHEEAIFVRRVGFTQSWRDLQLPTLRVDSGVACPPGASYRAILFRFVAYLALVCRGCG